MSTETQKVDVLGILDSEIMDIAQLSDAEEVREYTIRLREASLREVRAVVAELIEAAKAAHPFVGWESAGTTALRERLFDALARVGGVACDR